jgi:hypothetical protein
MFCLADLREMAKEGLLKSEDDPSRLERIIHLPATLQDVYSVYRENKDVLTREKVKCPDRADMYERALGLEDYREMASPELLDFAMKNTKLVYFEDSNVEENCVYCIAMNAVDKRVSISFRGSVTKRDFNQDAKAVFDAIDNPIQKITDPKLPMSEELGVQLGFREYLYGDTNLTDTFTFQKRKKRKEEAPEGKYKHEIILDRVKEIFAEHPDYRLYITGHSLGGALATLLSLEAAAASVMEDGSIPTPVTCITSGAPKVGNIDFLRAYEELEMRGHLRCLHIANDRDPVTLVPPNGSWDPAVPLCCPDHKFRHVGLTVKLRAYGYVMTYPPTECRPTAEFCAVTGCKWHGPIYL